MYCFCVSVSAFGGVYEMVLFLWRVVVFNQKMGTNAHFLIWYKCPLASAISSY
jgi:hypothetical protein